MSDAADDAATRLAGDRPAFAEPWEAQAFAMAVELNRAGLFTWTEWADALARAIASAQAGGDPDRGATYYRHWLAALESIVVAKGAARPEDLSRYAHAWTHAAGRTPHGEAITLDEGDFHGSEPIAPAR